MKNNYRTIASLVAMLLLGVMTTLQGQVKLDSLWEAWNDTGQADSVRLDALHKYAWNGFLFSDPDSAYALSELEYQHARKVGSKSFMAKAVNMQGVSYALRGDYKAALKPLTEAADLFAQLADSVSLTHCYVHIGNIHNGLGEHAEAIDAYEKSLRLGESLGMENSVASSLFSIGSMYLQQEEYTEAKRHFKKSLDISTELGHDYTRATNLSGLAQVYMSQGGLDSAKLLLKQALHLDSLLDHKLSVAKNLLMLSEVHEKLGELDSVPRYQAQSLALSIELGSNTLIASSYLNIGLFELHSGNLSVARTNCERSLEVMESSEDLQGLVKACDCLYQVHKKRGDWSAALAFHERSVLLKDSLQEEGTYRKLQQVEFRNRLVADSLIQVESELKTELAHQEVVRSKDRTQSLLLGLGAMLVLVATALYARMRYVRSSKKVIEEQNGLLAQALKEKEMLLREIHHRVKNNLQVMSGLLDLQSTRTDHEAVRMELAESKKRIYSISAIHDLLYRDANKQSVDAAGYFNKIIEQNRELQDAGHTFEVNALALELEMDHAIPLGLILNELLTNSYKHAFEDRGSGKIDVALREGLDAGRLVFQYADNGKGVANKEQIEESTSLGLRLISMMVRQLKGELKTSSENGMMYEISFAV